MIFWRNAYRVLSRTFDYSGRASRAEFWCWMRLLFLVVLVSSVAMVVGDMMVQSALDLVTLVLAPVISGIHVGLAGFLPTLSLTVRRLHDTGRSGEVVLAWLVLPLFAWIIALGIFIVTLGIGLVGGGPSVIPTYASLGVALAITLGVACWSVWLLSRNGEDGVNRFGDMPR